MGAVGPDEAGRAVEPLEGTLRMLLTTKDAVRALGRCKASTWKPTLMIWARRLSFCHAVFA